MSSLTVARPSSASQAHFFFEELKQIVLVRFAKNIFSHFLFGTQTSNNSSTLNLAYNFIHLYPVRTLAERIAGYLERQGLLERDAENSYLAGDRIESGAIEHLQGAGAQALIHHLPHRRWSTARAQGVHASDAAGD